MHDLSLSEKLILLATDEASGATVGNAGMGLHTCIGGAVLFEMIHADLLKLEDGRITTWPKDSMGSELYDIAMHQMRRLKQPKPIKYWIQRFGQAGKKLQECILKNLVEREILEHCEKRYLWFIKVQRYPELDASSELRIREHLGALLTEKESASEEDLVLLGLVRACKLVPVIFGKDISKDLEQQIDTMIDGEGISAETAKVIKEITAALFAVIIASSVATTVAVN